MEAVNISVYFPEGDTYETIEKIADSTGLSVNSVITKILEREVTAYRRDPSKLLRKPRR